MDKEEGEDTFGRRTCSVIEEGDLILKMGLSSLWHCAKEARILVFSSFGKNDLDRTRWSSFEDANK